MRRSELREHILKILFCREFHSDAEMQEQSQFYLSSVEKMEQSEKDYIEKRVFEVIAHIADIDDAISKISEGWTLNRIGKVELSILRLAYYEIQYDESIPMNVSINEAVELSKKYGGEESSSFVNGIIAKLVN